jgi:predicted NACHT family NTPase
MTENPLMLTVLAVVHWNRKQLPEQRADLYDAAVEYLLESRRELSEHPTQLRRECLQAVALRMFEDSEGVQRSLGRREAASVVAPMLGCAPREAEAFLEDEALYSGLLVSRTEGEVEFWHLTFQEYLAALELAMDDDYWARSRCRSSGALWRRVKVDISIAATGAQKAGSGEKAQRARLRKTGSRKSGIRTARW